jgi:hypothetical protein
VESGYSELEKCIKTGSLYPRFTKNENKIPHVDYSFNIYMYFIRLHLDEVNLFCCVYIYVHMMYCKLLKIVQYFSLYMNARKTNVIYIAFKVTKTIPNFFWNLA